MLYLLFKVHAVRTFRPRTKCLFQEMLRYSPETRVTAKSALGHRYLRDVVLQPPEVTPLLREAYTADAATGETADSNQLEL